MKRVFVAFSALLLVACAEKDSVPKVEDPNSIVVDGAPMGQLAFVEKYCEGKTDHETCVKVRRSLLINSTEGAVPRF